MLNAALIGFGGIAKSHRRAFQMLKELGKAQLVCAYDVNPEAFTKNVTINNETADEITQENINFYTDLEKMLAKEKIDFIDICVPSYLHKEMSVKMLERGYHVMCEKPMSLSYTDCLEMIEAANKSKRQLMIGQCLRFYPAFDYIKEIVDTKKYGEVIGAYFSRLSTPPTWGWDNWFMDPKRSGGCITDLHIHDVDIIRYLFGEPDAVGCRATSSVCAYDTVHSSFMYGNTPVTAIGDWTLLGIPFRAECRIDLEKATITFDTTDVKVYPKDGTESFIAPPKNLNGQFGELSYLIDVIEGRRENTKNPPESAATTVKLVELLRASADNGGRILEFK